jgi:hypothetical protein
MVRRRMWLVPLELEGGAVAATLKEGCDEQ